MPTTEIMEALRIASIKPFDLRWRQEMSGQASGSLRVADLGDALWYTGVRTSPRMRKAELNSLQAKIDRLRGSLLTFYMWNPVAEYPQSDPGGTVLGASTVSIEAVTDAHTLQLKGLPNGYVLTQGDMLEVIYADPEQHALHRIVSDVTASGSGVTPDFSIEPGLWAGAAADQEVNLARAMTEMRIVPGTYRPDMGGPLRGTITFDAVQSVNPEA